MLQIGNKGRGQSVEGGVNQNDMSPEPWNLSPKSSKGAF